jgi:hypothetical protein
VGYTIRKLLLNAAALEVDRLDAPRRLLIALSACLTTWLQDTASDGLDPNLVAAAAEDLEVAALWASWVRNDFLAAAALRDAMADEIDSAVAGSLDALARQEPSSAADGNISAIDPFPA